MQPHALAVFSEALVREFGTPRVLDVEHSIQAYKPTLSGSSSVTSYYIRPPDGMSVETLLDLFRKVPGFDRMNLTLTSILGLDTYHQPLISVDDYAKKYFGDNHQRIVRVVGKSDPAIEAMAAFIEGLRQSFEPSSLPRHDDFSVSGYRPPTPGSAEEVKLLFKPADANLLMKVERSVRTHLDEVNLGREIATSRHFTRGQAPELILSATHDSPSAHAYLEALARSLPRATAEEVAEATEAAHRAVGHSPQHAPTSGVTFARAVVETLPPAEVKRRAIVALAGVLRSTRFADGLETQVVQGGAAIEVTFPRTASSLWMASSFDERKHIQALGRACVAVRTDPALREGWIAQYRFDRKTGKLLIRAGDSSEESPKGMSVVPNSD